MSIPRVYADFQNVDPRGRLRLNCVGTTQDLALENVSLKAGMELRLCMEDVETNGIVEFSTDENLWVAVIDWDRIESVTVWNHSAAQLPDDALVVRGGRHDTEIIRKCTGRHPSGLRGISVVSAAGKTIAELSETVPHRTITTTTVGDVRKSGGDVILTSGRSPYHATLIISDVMTRDCVHDDCPTPSRRDIPRLFADFNNTSVAGRVRLNTIGTKADLHSQCLELHDGLEVVLYDMDEFATSAIVLYEEEEGWVAQVDWSKLAIS